MTEFTTQAQNEPDFQEDLKSPVDNNRQIKHTKSQEEMAHPLRKIGFGTPLYRVLQLYECTEIKEGKLRSKQKITP